MRIWTNVFTVFCSKIYRNCFRHSFLGVTTADGTAEAGNTEDYTATSELFSFITGDTPQLTYDVIIPIHDDLVQEDTERFTVGFTNAIGVNEGTTNYTVTVDILDNGMFDIKLSFSGWGCLTIVIFRVKLCLTTVIIKID